ncbi:MAG: sialidase family protein [Phycisphaerae bacterium]|jgi:sialidase-1|nr:sialidase family protein [Phycisphaerae bacterium]
MKRDRMQVMLFLAVVVFLAPLAITKPKTSKAPAPKTTAAGLPAEGELKPFLGAPKLTMKQVFKRGRFPNVAVAVDGTVLAFWNGVMVTRSEDGGETWGSEILVGKGFMGGGVTVNETNGEILAFVEKHHPPAPLTVYRSKDHGKTWAVMDVTIKPDKNGNVPNMHMNEHGITLRHGKHAGRIIRPSRHYASGNDRSKWPEHYTNAIYSDDGGKTWLTSAPFPANGTGEATLAELSNGQIYYNSRRHWAQQGADPRRRWTAKSTDGGATWTGLSICKILPDGPQNTNYGCMGGLVRLPVAGKDVLLYSNCDSPGGRHHMTVWASFDGGRSWPIKRLVFEGKGQYSSLDAGRPKTKSEGWIYLNFEGGPKGGSTVAKFNLSWVLKGKETGNGKLPSWITE